MFVDIPYDVYHYECALCKKEVKTETIKTCIICNRKICDGCFKEGFCLNHNNLLSSEDKSKLNELIEDNKKKKKILNKQKYIAYIISLAILFSSIILPAIYPIPVTYFSIYIIFFCSNFILLTILLLLFDKKKDKLFRKLEEYKKSLYHKYGKIKEIFPPKIKKKCKKCGRILESDSEYCDICGSKM